MPATTDPELADARDSSEPGNPRERMMVRVLARIIRFRGLFIPVLLAFTVWIGATDAAPWRQLLMFSIGGVMTTLIAYDAILTRRARAARPRTITKMTVSLVAIAVMQHLVIFATGGMASPAVPVLLIAAVVTGLVAEPRFAWLVVRLVQLPALWLTTSVQLLGLVELTPTALAWPDGSGGQPPITTLIIAILMSFALMVTTLFSTLTADMLNRMVADALRSRDAALTARSQQTRELTTLSGEIAHELKNPLASVKGLAQLVGRELERHDATGKSAERMAVLRREVDRMQSILDEFLNFSRPLVPLSQREVELRELVDHVVDLHEAVASERRVELRASGRARVICDPRKVEQILINLVQNALEVAPAGTAVTLEVIDDRPDAVRVEILDAGSGLADSVRARVFEPGVTGKHDGSGLGLTIARALARQHGGELELDDRPTGGCAARLMLPVQVVEHA